MALMTMTMIVKDEEVNVDYDVVNDNDDYDEKIVTFIIFFHFILTHVPIYVLLVKFVFFCGFYYYYY